MAGFWALNRWLWPGRESHLWDFKLATSRLARDFWAQKEYTSSHDPEGGGAVRERGWWAITCFFFPLDLGDFDPGFYQDHHHHHHLYALIRHHCVHGSTGYWEAYGCAGLGELSSIHCF